jgi:hypothetical protein
MGMRRSRRKRRHYKLSRKTKVPAFFTLKKKYIFFIVGLSQGIRGGIYHIWEREVWQNNGGGGG